MLAGDDSSRVSLTPPGVFAFYRGKEGPVSKRPLYGFPPVACSTAVADDVTATAASAVRVAILSSPLPLDLVPARKRRRQLRPQFVRLIP